MIINSGMEHFWGIARSGLHAVGGWRAECARVLDWTPYWMVFITTLVSIGTGVSYLRKNKALFEKDL